MIVHAAESRPAGFPLAVNVSRCAYNGQPPEDQGHYQFTVELYLHDIDGSLFLGVGDPPSAMNDLQGVVVHELGHTANFIDAPIAPFASVMDGAAVGEHLGHRYRTPYPFDINCAHRNRQPQAIKRIQRSCSGGTCYWSTPISMTPWDRAYLSGGGGGRYISGSFSLRYLGADDGYSGDPNRVGASGSYGNTALSYSAPLFVPRAVLGLWRDRDAARQRLLFIPPSQPVANDRFDEYRLSQRTSTDDFTSSTATTVVSRCSAMSDWMVCSGQQDVRTARLPSTAWAPNAYPYNPSGVAVTAWAEQDRSDVAKDGEVFIGIGSVGEAVVPQPNTAGVRSAVGPQVACRSGGASPQCVVVYAEVNPSFAVMAKRFDISVLREWDRSQFRFEDRRYQTPFVGAPVALGNYTSSRMALFYSTTESRYVLVLRSQNSGQDTDVYSSPDGATWTHESDIPYYFDVGPYAPGYRISTTNNIFVLTSF
ncbi:MAG: hypothetical protein IT383_15875 [Deltaproteobacteria bacterium]|nr:hypothetical protein [Deltaproteobacteria bacterium]